MARPTRRHVLSGIAALSAGIAGAGAVAPRRSAQAATGETVIVIAAPRDGEEYYAELYPELLTYCARFVAAVTGPETVLVLVDRQTETRLAGRVPAENLMTCPIDDIWIRDFAPIRVADRMVKFSYRPQYLSAAIAGWVENSWLRWQRKVGFEPVTTDIVLDGGNLVADEVRQAVTTERLFEDNPSRAPDELVDELKRLLLVERVAVLPQVAGDITGHADGMVAWIDAQTLAVARYPEPFRSAVLAPLEAALPGVALVEIPDTPTDRMWRGWPSAAGIYANGFATPYSFFLPLYDMAADDEAVAALDALTDKPVIPVPCAGVAPMGGAVRCLTWVLSGAPAAHLLAYQRELL